MVESKGVTKREYDMWIEFNRSVVPGINFKADVYDAVLRVETKLIFRGDKYKDEVSSNHADHPIDWTDTESFMKSMVDFVKYVDELREKRNAKRREAGKKRKKAMQKRKPDHQEKGNHVNLVSSEEDPVSLDDDDDAKQQEFNRTPTDTTDNRDPNRNRNVRSTQTQIATQTIDQISSI